MEGSTVQCCASNFEATTTCTRRKIMTQKGNVFAKKPKEKFSGILTNFGRTSSPKSFIFSKQTNAQDLPRIGGNHAD